MRSYVPYFGKSMVHEYYLLQNAFFKSAFPLFEKPLKVIRNRTIWLPYLTFCYSFVVVVSTQCLICRIMILSFSTDVVSNTLEIFSQTVLQTLTLC